MVVLAPFQGVAVELGCRCRSLRDVYGSGALTGIVFTCQKGRVFGAQKYVLLSGVYAGVIFSCFVPFGHWFSHSACGSQRGKSTAAAPSAQATASHAPATSTSKKYEEIVET
jgi:hypothetical protein